MDTPQHKQGRYCDSIKSTNTFVCILRVIHKLQITCTTKTQSTMQLTPMQSLKKKNNSLLFKLSKCQKVAGLSLTIYNLKHQCNSSLYLYHNKLVGFVLQDKEHTMLLTLVPELGCLRLRDERTTSKFSVLDLINFLLFYFQPNFSSQVYFNQRITDGC